MGAVGQTKKGKRGWVMDSVTKLKRNYPELYGQIFWMGGSRRWADYETCKTIIDRLAGDAMEYSIMVNLIASFIGV